MFSQNFIFSVVNEYTRLKNFLEKQLHTYILVNFKPFLHVVMKFWKILRKLDKKTHSILKEELIIIFSIPVFQNEK